MDNQKLCRTNELSISEDPLQYVLEYIHDPRDREAISLVCRRWYAIDCFMRKHVTIALCYTTSPLALKKRFPYLESLKLKGKPRAAMFNLIPENWGGYAGPWIRELSHSCECLKAIHLRRMIVKDVDLEILVQNRGHMLLVLKLDRCSGFSTDGLLQVAHSCRCLRTLYLEESSITQRSNDWLRELAVNNVFLENLNFYSTDLSINIQDLGLLARNCYSLVSLKISDCEILDLADFFRSARNLEEFAGGSFGDEIGGIEKYKGIVFPPKLCRLGLSYMGKEEMPLIFPFASSLKKLDLQYTLLGTEDHCQLIQLCPNLEFLEVRNVIGDIGLEVVARNCKKLKRIRIERGEDEQGMEDEQGKVSHRGLSALAEGCPQLEYLAVYVSDITNGALESLGTHSKNLCDFRLVLLDKEERITELPLDNGVRALLMGCEKLRRFALYLRPGALTDTGLSYIGRYSPNVRWMLLGCVGESDSGLLEFSRGCPKMQKLEIRSCCFTERALALAALQLVSLRYIWVQGYNATMSGSDLLAMIRPYWNIEFIPPRMTTIKTTNGPEVAEQPAQILAYYSLVGRRTDYPDTVVPLYPYLQSPITL